MKKGKPIIASAGLRQFMYLASHGLRNPLTSINWAQGRLRKLVQNTSEAQMYLDQIWINTRRLNQTLNAIFMVSRLQDQSFSLTVERMNLMTLVREAIPKEEDKGCVSIEGDITTEVQSDREVLHMLITCLFMTCFQAKADDDTLDIDVYFSQNGTTTTLVFRTSAQLQMLRSSPPKILNEGQEGDQLIGGTPGLLLALARDLAIGMGGYLKLEEGKNTFTVTVSLSES